MVIRELGEITWLITESAGMDIDLYPIRLNGNRRLRFLQNLF
jgi:hypothetical protein